MWSVFTAFPEAAKEEMLSVFVSWCAETRIKGKQGEGKKPHQGVEAITIGSLEWNDDRNRKLMVKAFRQGLKLYNFEWDHSMIGTWTDPVPATVRFRRGKVFQFFIRFN